MIVRHPPRLSTASANQTRNLAKGGRGGKKGEGELSPILPGFGNAQIAALLNFLRGEIHNHPPWGAEGASRPITALSAYLRGEGDSSHETSQ